MIFMTQSPEYKMAVSANKKLLMDYLDIDGTSLTAEDAIGITMLGKKSLEGLGNTHIAVVVDDTERRDIEAISKAIFADTQSQIIVTNNKQQALQALAGSN
jgi:hypothetical protein